MLDTALAYAKFHPIDHNFMHLVGDRVLIQNVRNEDAYGTLAAIDEDPRGDVSYFIYLDSGEMMVRYSTDDRKIEFVDNITLDFS